MEGLCGDSCRDRSACRHRPGGRIIASAVAQDTGNRGAVIVNGLPLSGSGVVVGIVAVGFIGAFLGFILYFVCSFIYWWFKT